MARLVGWLSVPWHDWWVEQPRMLRAFIECMVNQKLPFQSRGSLLSRPSVSLGYMKANKTRIILNFTVTPPERVFLIMYSLSCLKVLKM